MRTMRLLTIVLGVGLALPLMATLPAGAAGRAVTLTPSTDLVDGQQVTVDISGFTPGQLSGFCQLFDTDGVVDINDCSNAPIMTFTPSETGTFTAQATVQRFIFVSGVGPVDCAAPGGGCAIGAAEASDIAGTGVFAPLSFAAAPPLAPAITVTPDDDLAADQIVTVAGSGFLPNIPVSVAQCLAGGTTVPDCTDAFVLVVADASGAFSEPFVVLGAIGTTSCSSAPGACELRLTQGAAAVAPTAALTFDPDTSGRRPDGQIVRLINGSLIGNNIYNSDGTDQERIRPLPAGQRLFFGVRLQNDSVEVDDITVSGGDGISGFNVKYYFGYYDVTNLVTSGALTFHDIPATASRTLAVDITADASVSPGTTMELLLTLTSVDDPTKVDAVKVGVTVPV